MMTKYPRPRGIRAIRVVVSWMHNNAIDINDIGREYNHREHRGTQRIDLKTLCSLCPLWLNPVAFAACVGSIRPQHIRAIRTIRAIRDLLVLEVDTELATIT